tara:strand:- start:2430 stop:2594 length:165 start_codon:yes stop_codon:yes gene_type:complete
MIIFSAMDYIIGFLVGYFCKYFITTLKDIAEGKYFEHTLDYLDFKEPLTEDDLP